MTDENSSEDTKTGVCATSVSTNDLSPKDKSSVGNGTSPISTEKSSVANDNSAVSDDKTKVPIDSSTVSNDVSPCSSEVVKPRKKVFKRRNAALYTNDDE